MFLSASQCTFQFMKKIAFVTPSDADYGFRLTGIRHYPFETDSLEDALRKIMADPETGLLVIDERMLAVHDERQGVPEERLRELERQWQGILLILPSPGKPPPEAEDYAARLIRRAIGYHVRLKL